MYHFNRLVDPERNIDCVPAEEVDEELRTIKDGALRCLRASVITHPIPMYVESPTWDFGYTENVKKWNTNDSSDDEADNEKGSSNAERIDSS